MRHVLFILFALISIGAIAQPKNLTPANKAEEVGLSSQRLQRIDAMVEEHIKSKLIPGAAVFIARNGKVVYHKAYGFSNVEKNTPLKKDDIFRIASQSKAITALAVMILWEEGKFLLDDPISKFIPEFKNPTVLKTFNEKDSSYTTEPARSEITIRQLLTHSSGIDYAVIGTKEFKAIFAKAGVPSGIGSNNMKLGDKMKILGKLPLKHHPGERWTYGLNNDVLGYLVEVLSGISFDKFLKQRIFDPLGMKDTYFYLPTEKQSRLVALYDGSEGAIKKAASPFNEVADYPTLNGTYFSGGAGLSSTVEDYAKFLQLFLNKGEYNGVRLISRKTVELMHTDQKIKETGPVGLGFGLETDTNDGNSVLSLGSFSWGGAFNTHYWADPQEKLVGLIYTNVYQTQVWSIGEKFKVLTYQSIID
ncbi:serine hydrolase domain-containing protein [Pseudochryseolinea flava]|uniref:Serine hydrolase n=1 Tax=Pseudochryseolinea flava TaxID=2059302 RepID=A0A364Y187_9BACT|nr:serine hydrolase domain-containing protein [Pseudochryseolinea flava]RAV99856.1 serine hydrolase [Pseudochryseolinea flava]